MRCRLYLVGLRLPFRIVDLEIPDSAMGVGMSAVGAEEVCRVVAWATAGVQGGVETRPGDLVCWKDTVNMEVRFAIMLWNGGLRIRLSEAEEILMTRDHQDWLPTFKEDPCEGVCPDPPPKPLRRVAGVEAFRVLARYGIDPVMMLDTKSRYLAAIFLGDALDNVDFVAEWCGKNGVDLSEISSLRRDMQRILQQIERQ